MPPIEDQTRLLKFTQYIWIVASILAVIIVGRSFGAPLIQISVIALALLPALASLWVLSGSEPRPMGEALMLLGWTLLAVLVAASTGGARSPAIILFAIGPLTAFAFGNIRLTAECTAFAAATYLCTAAFGSFGLVPELGEPQATIGGAAAAVGITQCLVLMIAAFRLRASLEPELAAEMPAAPRENSSADDSQKLLKDRNAYFASLSHDLRSPFNAILGYAETFKMNLGGNLTDKQVDQASMIHESAEDLLSLVDDMMDLAKSEAGKLSIDPEPIHLGDLGKSIMQQMQAMADRKNLTVTFDTFGEPWAMADARLVRRIWQNLISNAIKYSELGGNIQLTASERARMVVLSVKDNGRGMSKEDLRRIAKPFEMGSNSNGKSGTGLGLVNVKRFTDMHGGRVVVDTAPGDGARFQVLLPKADVDGLEPL